MSNTLAGNGMVYAAQQMAHAAHDSIGQVRKYTGEPYWVHTDEVAGIIGGLGHDDFDAGKRMECAAHLHDVIEDVTGKNPKYDLFLIGNTFGKEVADLVVALTDVYTSEAWPDLNRAKRKELERQRIGKTSPAAKTIKLADLISNTKSIVRHDPDFAQVYIREKIALLPYLAEGNAKLLRECKEQVLHSAEFLGLDIPALAVNL